MCGEGWSRVTFFSCVKNDKRGENNYLKFKQKKKKSCSAGSGKDQRVTSRRVVDKLDQKVDTETWKK